MRSDISPLPIEHRFRADVVALCCGLAALPLAPLILRYSRPEQIGIAILLMIISLALAAGYGTVTFLNRAGLSSSDGSHLVRAGARAGLLTATLAAAMTVLSARIFQSQIVAMIVLVPALLSILPGSFFGMLATAFAVGILIPIAVKAQAAPDTSQRKARIFVLLSLACLVGFGSVLIPQRVGSYVTAASPSRLLQSSWRYEKPADLATADASRWELIETRPIGRVREGFALALSSTGDRLAYYDADQANLLKVVDLNQPNKSYSFVVGGQSYHLAFSPDGNQVLFETFEGGQRLGVADLPKGRVIMLPRPKGVAVPPGDISWPSSGEAIFYNAKPPFRLLDLDMLELDNTKKDVESAPAALPATGRVEFEIRRSITGAEVPNDPKQREWPMTGGLVLSVRAPDKNYRRFFNLDAQVGDRFLAAPDGSKLVRIRNNVAVVSYFGLRSEPALSFAFEMPKRAEEHNDSSNITTALAADDLCALVYAPLINPLNEKIIGPDRDRVKGLVRISSWKERSVSAWLAEEFQPIAANDVIADLHTWKSYAPQLMLENERRWWTKITAIADSQRDIASVPSSPTTKPLARTSSADLVADSGTLRVQNTESQIREATPVAAVVPQYTPVPQYSPIPTENPFSPKQSAAPIASRTPSSPRDLGPDDPAFQNVSAFIQAHHQKANRGDLNALINDYTDQVLFFDKGQVDKAYIFKNEAISRSSFQQMTEDIIYPIRIQQDDEITFTVQYQIAWDAAKKDGRHTHGTSAVFLHLRNGPQGLKIFSHNFDPYAAH